MAWRLVEIPDAEAIDADLSDDELVSASVILSHFGGESDRARSAWRKIQPATIRAIENGEVSDARPES